MAGTRALAEQLETRTLLSGWTAVSAPLPNGDSTGLEQVLLPNGKVLEHGGGIAYTDNYFEGQIDDVRIYPQALTAAEVDALYSGRSVPQKPGAEYEFNESHGTTSADSSGHGAVATLANGASFVPAHRGAGSGNALNLNGLNQFASVADAASLDPTTAITLSAWIDAAAWDSNRRILEKGAFDDQYRLLAEPDVNGDLSLKFDLFGVGTVTAPLPSLHSWHLVTGTWDGSTMNLYVDGAIVASVAATGALTVTTDPLIIGAKSNNDPNPTNTAWYLLSPDSKGNYSDGTWKQAASMKVARLYFSTDVLPDGKVLVVGGEYASDSGHTTSGEIYDPATNTWSNIAPAPFPSFGDDPTEVLSNGDVLAGKYATGDYAHGTAIYDPATNKWSPSGTMLYNDASDEEGWVKLPDGSILTYDIWSSINDGKFEAQRYVPATGKWVDASNTGGKTLPLLSTSATYELGPGVLLPDGRVIYFGATGYTAIYDPARNRWSAGPSLPEHDIDGTLTQLVMEDSSAAMLTNGDVLIEASGPSSDAPSFFYEFNPTTGVYTDVTPPQDVMDTSGVGFAFGMLDLPTGQVLVSNGTGQLALFTPSGGPEAAWRPKVLSLAANPNGTFTLTGTQLNGISEGAYYGDDAEMASNYPIVRTTDGDTGKVYYANVLNWSSTGVASGSGRETVTFALPAGLASHAYKIAVVANGIASAAIPGLASADLLKFD